MPALFKSGQCHFHQDNSPVHSSILVTDYLTKMGIKAVLLYTHLLIHAEIYIYMLDTYRRNDNRRMINDRRTNKRRMIKTQEGRRKKTSLEKYSPLTLLQGFERVVQGIHVRGCWRPNINFIFWPRCYDLTLCLSCSLGLPNQGPRGSLCRMLAFFIASYQHLLWTPNSIGAFRVPSRSGVAFPTTSGLYCLEFYWQLLWHPNSTELNNNSTPTRSPTGSLKLNV